MRQLSIGIDSWIIQDGNYGDFSVGCLGKFALEFADEKLTASTPGERDGQLLYTSMYRVKAKVIYARPDVWVIDFGVRAFSETAPPTFAQVGSWVEGEVFIGIDPFFYMEYLHKLPDMPVLSYDWKVETISRDDTPWLSTVNEQGGVTLSRDTLRSKWTEVERTLAWDDDEGRSSYVLRCTNSEV